MGEEAASESARPTSWGGGRYRILAELGRGGMANVYLALAQGPIGFNKLCVLKVLRELLADDPDAVEMFVNEARLAARLNHANVVQTYEVVEEAGRYAIVMEYLEGQSLAEICGREEREPRDRRLPLAMHLQVLSSVLAGLHYAHELADFDGRPLGVVHRDVSPQNVFVCFDGQVKVLDFGIAKALTLKSSATRTGVIKGKVRYMAPEQMAGEAVDRRADIFAAGALLWEAISGGPIWKDMVDSAVICALAKGEVPAPRLQGADSLQGLAAICAKAMSLDRDRRYATAGEMEIELDEERQRLGDSVKGRAIGTFVSDLFADTRKRTKATVEAAVSEGGIASAKELPSLKSEPARSGETETSAVFVPDRRSRPNQTGRHPWPWMVLSIAGALAILAIVAVRSSAPGARPPETVTPLRAATTRIVVHAIPVDATVLLDGAPIANPYLGTFTRDVIEHRVQVTRSGYATRAQLVRFNQDEVVVDISLVPSPGPADSTAPASSAPKAPPKSAAKPDGRRASPAPAPSASAVVKSSLGYLTLDTYPWTRVSEEGRDLGITPLVHLALPAGGHLLTLENPDLGIKQTYPVTVNADETVSRRLQLK
jgi:serine/threonine protein kinase